MRKNVLIWLILITLFGGFVRFYNIADIGVSNVDEAFYMLEADWIRGETYANLSDPMLSSKPLFSYLVSISFSIFGSYDYAGILVSAIFGTLSIPLLYLIGRHVHSDLLGLLAAALLATNKLHIYHSRTVYSEAVMMFFFALAFYTYLKADSSKYRNYMMILTGVVAGLAYDTKFISAVLLPVFAAFGLIKVLKTKRWKLFVNDTSMQILGFMLVFAITWVWHQSMGVSYIFFILHRIDQISIGKVLIEHSFLNDIPRYEHPWYAGTNLLKEGIASAYLLIKSVSLPVFGLLFLGLYRQLKKKDWVLLTFFVLISLFVFYVAYARARTLMFFPFLICLLAAYGIIYIDEHIRKFRKYAFYSVISITLLLSIVQSIDVIAYENHAFRQAGEYVYGEKSFSTTGHLISFYSKADSKGTFTCQPGYYVIDTWRAAMTENDCVHGLLDTEPVAEFDFRVQAWQFPFKEIDFFRRISAYPGLGFLGAIAEMLDNNVLTDSPDQKVMIYHIQ